MSRLRTALQWLAEQFSATADEFRAEFRHGADMLREGLVAHGYAREKGGRYAVTDTGRKVLEA